MNFQPMQPDADDSIGGPLSPEDLRQIERLIDGELEPSAQRSLLARIEAAGRAPVDDPWRQLALAFVESQTWYRELAVLRAECEPRSRETAAVEKSETAPPSAVGGVPFWPALAATALLAFGLGLFAQRGDRQQTAPESPPATVVSDPDVGSLHTLAAGDADLAPIFVRGGLQDLLEDPDEPVMPLHLIEALERAGHNVEHRRGMIPIELEDGTRLLLPLQPPLSDAGFDQR